MCEQVRNIKILLSQALRFCKKYMIGDYNILWELGTADMLIIFLVRRQVISGSESNNLTVPT